MNNTEQNAFYEKTILDAINPDDYGVHPNTDKERLQFLKKTFKDEYGWAISRMGEQNAFREWISGLPTAFNIPFENAEILALAKKSGSLPENATDKQEDRVLENYWNFMTVKTFQVFRKYKVE